MWHHVYDFILAQVAVIPLCTPGMQIEEFEFAQLNDVTVVCPILASSEEGITFKANVSLKTLS